MTAKRIVSGVAAAAIVAVVLGVPAPLSASAPNLRRETVVIEVTARRQTISGWGGNIYPSAMSLGADFLAANLRYMHATHMRVRSSFPARDPAEIALVQLLRRQRIKVILGLWLDIPSVGDPATPARIARHLKRLAAAGAPVEFVSLNEPDAQVWKGLPLDKYVALVRSLSAELALISPAPRLVGPDTTTPRLDFMRRIRADVGRFAALTYHSYAYKGLGDLESIAEFARAHALPIWVTEQNHSATGQGIATPRYALANIRNLIDCLNRGRVELALFFAYAWGRKGGVVLFDTDKREIPLYAMLAQIQRHVPAGSVVVATRGHGPAVAFDTGTRIVLVYVNEGHQSVLVHIESRQIDGARTAERLVAPESLLVLELPKVNPGRRSVRQPRDSSQR